MSSCFQCFFLHFLSCFYLLDVSSILWKYFFLGCYQFLNFNHFCVFLINWVISFFGLSSLLGCLFFAHLLFLLFWASLFLGCLHLLYCLCFWCHHCFEYFFIRNTNISIKLRLNTDTNNPFLRSVMRF